MWTNYRRMIVSLPDVNIWIALAAEDHVHHVPARDWFAAQPAASVAFCRITQMGLLRLLTNSTSGGPPSN
jgi:predicted nucleic acid-binding protein